MPRSNGLFLEETLLALEQPGCVGSTADSIFDLWAAGETLWGRKAQL